MNGTVRQTMPITAQCAASLVDPQSSRSRTACIRALRLTDQSAHHYPYEFLLRVRFVGDTTCVDGGGAYWNARGGALTRPRTRPVLASPIPQRAPATLSSNHPPSEYLRHEATANRFEYGDGWMASILPGSVAKRAHKKATSIIRRLSCISNIRMT